MLLLHFLLFLPFKQTSMVLRNKHRCQRVGNTVREDNETCYNS